MVENPSVENWQNMYQGFFFCLNEENVVFIMIILQVGYVLSLQKREKMRPVDSGTNNLKLSQK